MRSMSLAHRVSCPLRAYASNVRPVRGYGAVTKVSSIPTAHQNDEPSTGLSCCITSGSTRSGDAPLRSEPSRSVEWSGDGPADHPAPARGTGQPADLVATRAGHAGAE